MSGYQKRDAKWKGDAATSDLIYGAGRESHMDHGTSVAAAAHRQIQAEKFKDGLLADVADKLWDQACAKHRSGHRQTVDKAQAVKCYKALVEAEKARLKRAQERKEKDKKKKAEKKAAAIAAAEERKVSPPPTIPEEEPVTEFFEVDPSDWDDDDCYDKRLNSSDGHVDAAVRGVRMESAGDVVMSTPHGHPVLAASRSAMAYQLRREGILKMQAAVEKRPGCKAVVFEVGAGSTGIKNAVKLCRNYVEARDVYHHCTFPVAGRDDLARDHLLLGRTTHARDVADYVNWVDRTGVVMAGKVNACSHLARECDCLGKYDTNFVFALHSAYYFRDDDWEALFRYTDDVRIGAHYPEYDRQHVPCDRPEFRWDYLKTTADLIKHAGFWGGATMAAERALLNKKHVAFVPVTAHGTTYAHRDLGEDIKRGGFHIVQYSKNAEQLVGSAAGQALMLAGAVGAVAQLPRIGRALARLDFGSAMWETAKAGLCAAPMWFASGVAQARDSTEAPGSAKYTVKVVPGWSYSRLGETLCQVYQMRRVPVSNLESRTLKTPAVVVKKASEIAASVSLSNNPEKAAKAAVAMGFRAGLSPVEVRDTMAAVKLYLDTASGNGQCSEYNTRPPDQNPELSVWGGTRYEHCSPNITPQSLTLPKAIGLALATGAVSELAGIGFGTVRDLKGIFVTAAGTAVQLRSVMDYWPYQTTALVGLSKSEKAQAFWAWFSQQLESSRTAQQWLLTLSSSVTSQPRPIQ